MAHTPGPWETGEIELLGSRRKFTNIMATKDVGWASKGRTIAEVGHWEDRTDSEADARLIAAAPDLLAACEAARLWLDHPFHEATARQVDAAILKAKAKGE